MFVTAARIFNLPNPVELLVKNNMRWIKTDSELHHHQNDILLVRQPLPGTVYSENDSLDDVDVVGNHVMHGNVGKRVTNDTPKHLTSDVHANRLTHTGLNGSFYKGPKNPHTNSHVSTPVTSFGSNYAIYRGQHIDSSSFRPESVQQQQQPIPTISSHVTYPYNSKSVMGHNRGHLSGDSNWMPPVLPSETSRERQYMNGSDVHPMYSNHMNGRDVHPYKSRYSGHSTSSSSDESGHSNDSMTPGIVMSKSVKQSQHVSKPFMHDALNKANASKKMGIFKRLSMQKTDQLGIHRNNHSDLSMNHSIPRELYGAIDDVIPRKPMMITGGDMQTEFSNSDVLF